MLKALLRSLVGVVAIGFVNVSALAAVKVAMEPQPNPPETGSNTLHITVTDGDKPVEDAKLSLLVSMPAMGSMPYMEMPSTMEKVGAGKFASNFDLSMGGTWELTLTIETKDKKETRLYSLTTGIPGISDKNSAGGDHSAHAGTLNLGVNRLQKIGVRTAEVKANQMEKSIRAVGVVEADSSRRAEVSLRSQGYIQRILRGRVGETVKAGQPLFTVYSPELVTAQNEFLLAHNLGRVAGPLHSSSAERLRNLGMAQEDIAEIQKSGKPKREVTFVSPINGTILEVNAREGASVNAGDVLYVIGDLQKTFLVARVFQQDLANLKVGQPVRIHVPESEAGSYEGEVDLLFPNVAEGSGTGNVRVVPKKFIRELRPGLYVDLRFTVNLGERLSVPTEAILYSGLNRYVFVDLGNGVLEPREVTVGKHVENLTEIKSGLKPGEKVVVSGNFLLSSEAQLRSALPKWKKEGAK